METPYVLQLPSSSAESMSGNPPTLFRVRRKRHAEPHEALVLSLKRARVEDILTKPIICQLADISSFHDANIIDVEPMEEADNQATVADSVENVQKEDENENPLSMFSCLETEDTENKPAIKGDQIAPSSISLNGVPLQVIKNSGYVFDYYWSVQASGCTADQIEKVRLARSNELELVNEEDTDSSLAADDDDDSNDENNWRNDYPDELENTSTEDEESEQEDDGYNDIQRGIDEFDLDEDEDDDDDV